MIKTVISILTIVVFIFLIIILLTVSRMCDLKESFPAEEEKELSDYLNRIYPNIYNRSRLSTIDKDLFQKEQNDIRTAAINYLKRDCQIKITDWKCSVETSNCTQSAEVLTGNMMRTSNIIQPKFGGLACPKGYPKTDTGEACSVNCAIDCILDKGTYTTCTGLCDGTNTKGLRNHEFSVLKDAKHGGKTCYDVLKDLGYSDKSKIEFSNNKYTVKSLNCDLSCPKVDCVSVSSVNCIPKKGAVCDKITGKIDGTNVTQYNIGKESQYGGQPCDLSEKHEEAKCDCAVPCEGSWKYMTQVNSESDLVQGNTDKHDYCPTIGFKKLKYIKTVDAKNMADTCYPNGKENICKGTKNDISLAFYKSDGEYYCIQTRAHNNSYWGYPAKTWDLYLWYHDKGVTCYKNTNEDKRFRVNFRDDGLIQSVVEPDLYMAAGTEAGAKVFWGDINTPGNKWFVRSDNKIQLNYPTREQLCMSPQIGYGFYNTLPVTVDTCTKAEPIIIS